MSSRKRTERSTGTPRRLYPGEICTYEGCDQRCYYGPVGGKRERCRAHKKPGQINLQIKRCEGTSEVTCMKSATYRAQAGDPVRWCKDHAPADTISHPNEGCMFEGCTTRRSFGMPGGTPEFCSRHKGRDHINLNAKLCPKCKKSGHLPDPEDDQIRWCSKHVPLPEERTIPKIVSQLAPPTRSVAFCDITGCRRQALFGHPAVGFIHRCGEHREEEYTNLRKRKCEQCSTIPNFGFDSDSSPRWCARHAPEGARNIVSKRCQEVDCAKMALVGPTRGKFIHCMEHRTAEDIISRIKQCSECSSVARWGPSERTPDQHGNLRFTKIRCHAHRLPDDISFIKAK